MTKAEFLDRFIKMGNNFYRDFPSFPILDQPKFIRANNVRMGLKYYLAQCFKVVRDFAKDKEDSKEVSYQLAMLEGSFHGAITHVGGKVAIMQDDVKQIQQLRELLDKMAQSYVWFCQ
ncbi:hypothetical protein [Oenococcus sicerae]|uniref:hypothetical protein n=1 Tax=Oenococcus sicerae TaxID=2203724 RepID=UPI0039EC6A7A